LLLVLLLAGPPGVARSHAQVVSSDPAFPTADGPVTLTFRASEGDMGLSGHTGDVYIHAGVITNLSTVKDGCGPNAANWRYVRTAWGVNTAQTRMTRTAPNTYTLTIDNIRSWFGVPASEDILRLAMVFRDASGNRTGKAAGSCDIFLDLFHGDLAVSIVLPQASTLNPVVRTEPGTVDIRAVSLPTVDGLTLYVDGTDVHTVANDTLEWALPLTTPGRVDVRVEARQGSETAESSFYAVLVDAPSDAPRPPGIVDGITYDPTDPSRVTLSVFAPWKSFIHVIGDFNGWEIHPEQALKRDAIREDSVHWWITLDGLEPGREYAFQYVMDGDLRLADPYAEKVLSPEDSFIPASIYPELKPYPEGQTLHAVSVLQTAQEPFEWTVDDFQRPPAHELVIYELLVRDFLEQHDWSTLIDTLGYLERLGVNAIELMPPNEFEGNSSWGYNPSFHFAVDKYYGPADDLKRFVDAAHARGMVVIMDIVLNHTFGQSPLARQYWSGSQPTAQNPWFNTVCAHPSDGTCFGVDFDHESPSTKAYVDRVTRHWLTEYRMDGFRFDLTKGFTNNNSGGNYDADRIAIVKRMMDALYVVDPEAYVILEHWTGWTEERQLAEHGALVWANITHGFQQSTMGYASGADISGIWFGRRSWTLPNVVAYMESHDEERLMAKNRAFGNAAGTYSTQDVPTALDRMKAAAAFLLTTPGPKMIWQFGELGYDVSIDFNGRTGEKPIRWSYLDDPDRARLRDTYASLIRLRAAHEVFTSPSTAITQDLGGLVKSHVLTLGASGASAVVVGNFDVVDRTARVTLPQGGTWFDFFGRRSMEFGAAGASHDMEVTLAPGQFHVFLNEAPRVTPPEGLMTVDVESKPEAGLPGDPVAMHAPWPNPLRKGMEGRLTFDVSEPGPVVVELYSMLGQRMAVLDEGYRAPGRHQVVLSVGTLSAGSYVVRLVTAGGHTATRTITLF
jgi:1,4-alpha-glucan branching enzyme